MIETVFLVEFPDEGRIVLDYLKHHRLAPSQYLIIGIDPSVRAWLKNRGISASETLDYFSNESHVWLLTRIRDLLDPIEKHLHVEFKDGLAELYNWTFIVSTYYRLVLVLRNIKLLDAVRQRHPDAVLAVCGGDRESHLASVSRDYCRVHGYPLKVISSPNTGHALSDATKRHLRSLQRSVLQRLIGLLSRVLGRVILRLYLSRCRKSGSRNRVVIYTSHHSLATLLRSVTREYPQVRLMEVRPSPVRLKALWKESLSCLSGVHPIGSFRTLLGALSINIYRLCRHGPTYRPSDESIKADIDRFMATYGDQFHYKGVSLYDCIRGVLMKEGRRRVTELHRHFHIWSLIIESLRPALFLAHWSAGVSPGIAALCKQRRTPSMVIPLKTIVKGKNELEHFGQHLIIGRVMVKDVFTYFAAQSPSAAEYVQETGFAGEVIQTGPLIFSRVDETSRRSQRERFLSSSNEDSRIVLYAPSMKRICFPHITETLDEVMRSMTDVANAAAALNDTLLIIRLHPDGVIRKSTVETLLDLPENVRVIDAFSEGGRSSFAADLALADLLITNMSTSSEEAILNGIPVILYDRWNRYNHLDAPTVSGEIPQDLSPAYYVSSEEILARSMKWVLDNHPWRASIADNIRERYLFSGDFRNNFYDFVERCIK